MKGVLEGLEEGKDLAQEVAVKDVVVVEVLFGGRGGVLHGEEERQGVAAGQDAHGAIDAGIAPASAGDDEETAAV